MPTKTSVGPNEVVRLEVLRLAPPLSPVQVLSGIPGSCLSRLSRMAVLSSVLPLPRHPASCRLALGGWWLVVLGDLVVIPAGLWLMGVGFGISPFFGDQGLN
jgi:hypothetical protein